MCQMMPLWKEIRVYYWSAPEDTDHIATLKIKHVQNTHQNKHENTHKIAPS